VTTTGQTSSERGTQELSGAAQTALTSQSIQYAYIYSSLAKGTTSTGSTTWQLYGRAEDWHGRSSGNVPVGTGHVIS